MKKTIYLLLILGMACFAYDSYAAPPKTRTGPVALDQSNAYHLLKAAAINGETHLTAILVDNTVRFDFAAHRMVWKIGAPTGQLHEGKIYAKLYERSGIHRMRYTY